MLQYIAGLSGITCLSSAVAVGDVSRDTGRVDDVEQRQVIHLARELHEERHRLSDSARGPNDSHLLSQEKSREILLSLMK